MQSSVLSLTFISILIIIIIFLFSYSERNHRAYNNKRDAAGPVYITIGDGGNREGLATKWLAETPVSAFREATYGHGEITLINSTACLWTWHTK